MKKATAPRAAVVTGLVTTLLVLAGCASPGSEPTQGGSEPSESPGAYIDWQADAPPQWAEILAAGQEEGEVVLDSSPELLQSDFAADFERDTGIKITSAAGESSARYTAMEQEAQASQLTIDVSLGGGTELRMRDGLLQDVKEQLVLPNVTDPANWISGEGPTWMDKEGKFLLRGSSYVFGWIVVNADTFDANSFESWDDLLDPALKGRIATYDPVSGPGQATSSFFFDILGEDYVRDLYVGQEPGSGLATSSTSSVASTPLGGTRR